jgi:hypothetical protein
MGVDRRKRKVQRTPERRYADRRQAHTFRAVVDELLARGEIEIVETMWGREFRRLPGPEEVTEGETFRE